METVIFVVDVAALLASLSAAWLWFRASGRTVRRISYREVLDAADYNRIVTALNRTQLLNGRAAAASGVAALLVGLRLFIDLVTA
jgi:hypothetical protein